MIIDVHAHAIPPAFLTYLRTRNADIGFDLEDTPRGPKATFGTRTTAPMRADLGDLGARIESMDAAGVDVQVMAGWIDLTGYEIAADRAAEYSRAHNDALAEHAAEAADRFWPIGTVPLQAPPAAAQELARIMSDGFRGIEIATTVQGRALDQAGLDPVWEAASDLGAFVLLHPMTPLTGVDLDRLFMSNAVGRPAETSITIAGLILSGVLERFPDLRLCAVHGGGFTPFQIGRLDRAFHAKPDVAGAHISRPPSTYLRQMYVDTIVHDPAVLRFVIDSLGADHVLLGTDYPFEMGDLDPLAILRAVPGLEPREVAAIAGGNADRLMGSL